MPALKVALRFSALVLEGGLPLEGWHLAAPSLSAKRSGVPALVRLAVVGLGPAI